MMVPVLTFRNCRIVDAKFGELFFADDGEKFIIGRAGDGKPVAVMLEGDSGARGPFYFSLVETWNRHGVAVEPSIVVDPTSLAKPDAIPPGSIALDQGTVHILGFSGQSHQPVAIKGEGERPSGDSVVFTKWSATIRDNADKPAELFAFGGK